VDEPTPAREVTTPVDLLPAAGAALAAAIVTGVIWAYVVKISDYEIGFAAWGIGFLVGTAAVLVARGRKSIQLATIAVVAALIGILLGKYLSFVFIVRDELSDVVDVPIFSGDTWSLFMDNKDVVFSFWDILWIGLAVVTAFRVARPEEPRREPEPA
jgi:hypothetical protein